MRPLPIASTLGARAATCARAGAVTLVLLIGASAAHTLLGVGGPELDQPVRDWVSSAAYLIAAAMVALRAFQIREQRRAWLVLAAGLTLYGCGNVLWALWVQHLAEPPIPSVCDVLWLSLYPFTYVALIGLARSGTRLPAGVWLDGILVACGVAAIGAALVFGPVLDAASGSTVAVATNLAYPIADLLLAGMVFGVLALRGFRVDRVWGLLGAGFLLLCVGDITYLLQVAGGATESSPIANLFYLGGVALPALAAWQLPGEKQRQRGDNWATLAVPTGLRLAALGLLVLDHTSHLDPLALTLALLTILVAFVRTGLTFRDVRALAESRHEAVTDDLTSLPNRRLFLRSLDESIADAHHRGGTLALLLIDLDHFKELNDTLGHHAGDVLLRQIGPRLRSAVRSTDLVARLGGDEFGLLLGAPSDEASAIVVAAKVHRALGEPFHLQGLNLHVAASVGIALFPEHARDGDALLQRADVAMYQAKASGRTGCQVYAQERDTHSRERLALIGELPQAIAGGELEVHFQPKALARERRIVGTEALVRWRHPRLGLLPPSDFVPLAEQTGAIRALTRWVLDQALAQCSAWRAAGHDLHMAVNVTVADLLDSALPNEVATALEAHGLPPEALVLEITESSVISDPVRIGDVLARLGELGIGLALDDFGTGYSSLDHLRTLPVSEIKVDRSFVARMGSDATDAAIVRSTINLAQSLGMHVVAEGVEDDATWSSLAEDGCELVQGYVISRPVPAAELEELLRRTAAPR